MALLENHYRPPADFIGLCERAALFQAFVREYRNEVALRLSIDDCAVAWAALGFNAAPVARVKDTLRRAYGIGEG